MVSKTTNFGFHLVQNTAFVLMDASFQASQHQHFIVLELLAGNQPKHLIVYLKYL
jgi:hypothetical protein